VSDSHVTQARGPRTRLLLLAAGVVPAIVIIIGASLEWSRLLVNGRVVVVEDGLSLWQGVTAMVAAALGAIAMALLVASGRGRPAALVALLAGALAAAVSAHALVFVVTRPEAIAATVRAGAESIPLPGYVVPEIQSIVGPGAWMAFSGGVLLALVGLGALVASAWRRRSAAGGAR
jgi:hypothetical protein